MNKRVMEQFTTYNQYCKRIDEVYHQYAKRNGLSDTALWLLYSLNENSVAYTQRELCSIWHYPPQTINSALKQLENQKYIRLEPIPLNKKNKQIILTKSGEELSKKIILPLLQAEERSFQSLGEQECNMLLSITKKYSELLQEETNKIL